ncbi:2OG-Fe(II) oxygenase superfamily domain-containing protein [Pleurostoma richardsiae]|uniref:2OG-Fe(II) oxygenase superfamily domain-containing protein n=1 Tax=Pleurostoma richardsiae TaxID=41990 RepID=A0AA38RRK7_9PEZI|nr:2OG-Fe(II) oxygenase superfamily domain-containing protein [Pleurostoma richardsiae]
MEDLNPNFTSPISGHAAAQIPLATKEAVIEMRRELFSEEVLDNCLHSTRPGAVQLRGHSPRFTKFIYEFWHHPLVLGAISKAAGVDLVPAYDYEIASTNVQLGSKGIVGLYETPAEPPAYSEEQAALDAANTSGKRDPIIGWHRDAHPFVCVLMLSDARHMQGGETAYRREGGEIAYIKAPQMGYGAILQGRYITHMGIPASGMGERIVCVTSFRPRDPLLEDSSVLDQIRKHSHHTEIYYQYTLYRLEVLQARMRAMAEELRGKYAENTAEGGAGMCFKETVNKQGLEKWAREQMDYLRVTYEQVNKSDPRPVRLEDCWGVEGKGDEFNQV